MVFTDEILEFEHNMMILGEKNPEKNSNRSFSVIYSENWSKNVQTRVTRNVNFFFQILSSPTVFKLGPQNFTGSSTRLWRTTK